MPDHDQKDKKLKIFDIVSEVVKFDAELRKKYQIGHKFRFVLDRLNALLDLLEKSKTVEVVKKATEREAKADEKVLYVYLYNVHGVNLSSWQNLLTAKLFQEYSVNRPIYTEKSHIEKLLKSKKNIMQHAYFAIAVKQSDVYSNHTELKDALGHSLVKIKEGGLRIENLITFTHNHQEYSLNSEGRLIKKN